MRELKFVEWRFVVVKVEELNVYEGDMIAWRRDFHQHPEIGFKEFRTASIVAEHLEKWGYEVHKEFCETAVVGILKTGKPGKVVGIRADMDCLGMQDLKDVAYKSQVDGLCHSCGHDSHTAILMGIAKYFSDHSEHLCGTLKLIFQPAEEGPPPGGAKLLMEDGILDDVDLMLGMHTHASYEAGQIIFRYDELFASGEYFDIEITGKGGHGAYPHFCNNPITAMTQAIPTFQHIISQEIDAVKSGVVSVCNVHSGDAKNVIPNKVNFAGTIRTLDEGVRLLIHKRMDEILEAVCKMHQCQYELDIEFMFPILKNDNDVVAAVEKIARQCLGDDRVEIMKTVEMGCEDFAYYSREIPSCYFYFGVRNEEKNCVEEFHHPLFDIDESCFTTVQAVMINAATELLKK